MYCQVPSIPYIVLSQNIWVNFSVRYTRQYFRLLLSALRDSKIWQSHESCLAIRGALSQHLPNLPGLGMKWVGPQVQLAFCGWGLKTRGWNWSLDFRTQGKNYQPPSDPQVFQWTNKRRSLKHWWHTLYFKGILCESLTNEALAICYQIESLLREMEQ